MNFSNDEIYKRKYLKYKAKYLQFKQKGGATETIIQNTANPTNLNPTSINPVYLQLRLPDIYQNIPQTSPQPSLSVSTSPSPPPSVSSSNTQLIPRMFIRITHRIDRIVNAVFEDRVAFSSDFFTKINDIEYEDDFILYISNYFNNNQNLLSYYENENQQVIYRRALVIPSENSVYTNFLQNNQNNNIKLRLEVTIFDERGNIKLLTYSSHEPINDESFNRGGYISKIIALLIQLKNN